jgi:hypothetical protein
MKITDAPRDDRVILMAADFHTIGDVGHFRGARVSLEQLRHRIHGLHPKLTVLLDSCGSGRFARLRERFGWSFAVQTACRAGERAVWQVFLPLFLLHCGGHITAAQLLAVCESHGMHPRAVDHAGVSSTLLPAGVFAGLSADSAALSALLRRPSDPIVHLGCTTSHVVNHIYQDKSMAQTQIRPRASSTVALGGERVTPFQAFASPRLHEVTFTLMLSVPFVPQLT